MKIRRMSLNALITLQIVSGSLLALLIMAVFAPNSYSAEPGWKPTGTVEIVVGTAAGSGSDLIARTMARILKEKDLVNANIIVLNKTGGGGAISWEYVNKHVGNGHYLLPTTETFLTEHITGNSPLTYVDFTPLASLAKVPCVFTVRSDSPIKTGKDLTDRLRKDPKSISIAFASMRGNYNHAAVALVMKEIGGDLRELKIAVFDSSAKTEMAVLGGHVDLAISPPSNVKAQKEAGKLRPIAVADTKRLGESFADVPTWREQGLDVVMGSVRTIVGPKGMSEAQIAYWDSVFAKLSQLDDWQKYLKNTFSEGMYLNSRESKQQLATQYDQLKYVLTSLGMAKK